MSVGTDCRPCRGCPSARPLPSWASCLRCLLSPCPPSRGCWKGQCRSLYLPVLPYQHAVLGPLCSLFWEPLCWCPPPCLAPSSLPPLFWVPLWVLSLPPGASLHWRFWGWSPVFWVFVFAGVSPVFGFWPSLAHPCLASGCFSVALAFLPTLALWGAREGEYPSPLLRVVLPLRF